MRTEYEGLAMSEPEAHSTLWAGTVAEVERQTERKIDRDYVFRDLRSLDDLKNKIEGETVRVDAFRSEQQFE